MGSVNTGNVRGQFVFFDNAFAHRWLDAFGPNVVKVVEEFQKTPFDAADTPGGCTVTLAETGAGDTTLALAAGANGGELLITTDAADNDGANIQYRGEAFSFASAWPAYFGIRLKVSEATQSDLLAGLCITDTDLLGGLSDGVYFRKVDGSTAISFVLEKNSVETEIASVHALAADTYLVLEFAYDGTDVRAYVNGSQVAQVPATNANFCNDEFLTPSLHFLTGAAAAITCNVDWIRAIQMQA
jgi:hypothetical protein